MIMDSVFFEGLHYTGKKNIIIQSVFYVLNNLDIIT